jgi:hypothetical protein
MDGAIGIAVRFGVWVRMGWTAERSTTKSLSENGPLLTLRVRIVEVYAEVLGCFAPEGCLGKSRQGCGEMMGVGVGAGHGV